MAGTLLMLDQSSVSKTDVPQRGTPEWLCSRTKAKQMSWEEVSLCSAMNPMKA